MSIKFYYSPMSSATRVHWALEELGVPYEKHKVDLSTGAHKKADFLAINPNGKIPALVDGDVKLFESLAIVMWLGDKYGVEKGLWPKHGTPEYGEALSWAVWGTTECLPCVVEVVLHAGTAHFSLPQEKRVAHIAESARERWVSNMRVLEGRLDGREYLMGKSFTLVDCANAAVVGMGAMMAQLPIAELKNVSAWIARCQQRPAMGRAMAG